VDNSKAGLNKQVENMEVNLLVILNMEDFRVVKVVDIIQVDTKVAVLGTMLARLGIKQAELGNLLLNLEAMEDIEEVTLNDLDHHNELQLWGLVDNDHHDGDHYDYCFQILQRNNINNIMYSKYQKYIQIEKLL